MTSASVKTFDPLIRHPVCVKVAEEAVRLNGEAYLVGGAVRDFLLKNVLASDLDFTVINASARELAKNIADNLSGHLVALDWEFGIHRVVLPAENLTLDFSDALENNLETDLARRDLTINALCLNLQTGELIDPYNGASDLQTRTVRMVSEANLVDDPLRLLRVFRFAATLRAEIDPETLGCVTRHKDQLLRAAGERIHYEFFRMLDATPCFPALRAMADCGLLEVIVPEMTPMRTIQSSGFHHLGLFDHTLELVRQAEQLFPECPPQTRDWVTQPFNAHFSRFGLLKLACLLHDVGKPDTMGCKVLPSGEEKLTFYGHEMVGDDMSDVILKRLKTSKDIRTYVCKLVRWHLYPCQFGPDSPRKSVMRFFRKLGDETPDVVLLALADRHSTLGTHITPEEIARSHDAHLWLLSQYHTEEKVLKLPPLLNGHQMMQALGIGPGPHLKEMTDALNEARQLDEIETEAEALDWLLRNYRKNS